MRGRKQCPICRHHWFWQLGDGRFKCRHCGHRYTFHSAWNIYRLPQRVKIKLLDYFVLGVPVYRLRFKRLASYRTIEKFFRTIRYCLAYHERCQEPFKGVVECDETMFGGRKVGKRGWGARGKIIVLGILQRNGKVRVFPVKGRSANRLIPLITRTTKPGSLYYTDEWHAYASLSVRGGHIVIKKEKGHPKGRNHLNGIEGFWSYAKHWLYHYRGVPKKFFHFYLGEISFRFNHRDKDIFPLIYQLLQIMPLEKINKI